METPTTATSRMGSPYFLLARAEASSLDGAELVGDVGVAFSVFGDLLREHLDLHAELDVLRLRFDAFDVGVDGAAPIQVDDGGDVGSLHVRRGLVDDRPDVH